MNPHSYVQGEKNHNKMPKIVERLVFVQCLELLVLIQMFVYWSLLHKQHFLSIFIIMHRTLVTTFCAQIRGADSNFESEIIFSFLTTCHKAVFQ